MSYKEHKHCPECGSRDNRAVYVKQDDDGKVYQDSYCWGCDRYFDPEKTNDLDGDVPEDYEVRRSDMELSESDLLKIEKVLGEEIRGWADRMISKEACQRYKVRTKFDQEGKVSLRYYPSTYQGELVGFHVRNDKVKQARKLDKDAQGLPFFPIGKCNKSCELFGQSLFPKGGKFLVITGGEEDAMVVWQSLRNKSKGYETAVVSPTIGETAAHKQILENRDYIKSFEKIVVMMDNDKAGRRAAESISKLFSYGKVAVAELPQKDPCEVLKCGGGDNPSERRANGEKLIREAFWNSMPKKPSQVLTVDDIVEKAMKAPTMGLSFPWVSATKATLGIRRGEVHIVGAAPKIG